MNKDYFNGKVVWITGASSGIGEALAFTLATFGARLILSARSIDKLEAVRRNLPCDKENVKILPLDLSSTLELPSRTKEALAAFGRVDIMIHNGGVSQRSRAIDTKMEITETIMSTNFFGAVAITKELLPSMVRQGSGHFVVISSVMGKFGAQYRSSYAASKHALHGYFDSIRMEHVGDNIRVTMVVPGYIRTNVSANAFEADGSKHGRLDAGQARGMSPEICAKKIVKAVAARKPEVLVGGFEVMGVLAKRWCPALLNWILPRTHVDG